MTILFIASVVTIAILAAMVASVCGFGIGSLLTPTLNLHVPIGLSVAIVSFPHFIATVVRAAKLKNSIDIPFLKKFGLASAIGSLVGALIATLIQPAAQSFTLASLMIFVGILGLSGKTKDFVIPPRFLYFAGALSGLLGGAVGNQGGVRSAALLSTKLKKEEFVATATATGVVVDLFRMPVYIYKYYEQLQPYISLIAVMTIACVLGTFLGVPMLRFIPENRFKQSVYIIVFALGLFVMGRLLAFPKMP